MLYFLTNSYWAVLKSRALLNHVGKQVKSSNMTGEFTFCPFCKA